MTTASVSVSHDEQELLLAIRCGRPLAALPEASRTYEICRKAIEGNPFELRATPDTVMDEALVLMAVRVQGNLLSSVAESLRTVTVCLAAVSNRGDALQHVPLSMRTKTLCAIAVANNGDALTWVPVELRNKAICRSAAEQGMGMAAIPMRHFEPLSSVLAEALAAKEYDIRATAIRTLFITNWIAPIKHLLREDPSLADAFHPSPTGLNPAIYKTLTLLQREIELEAVTAPNAASQPKARL